MGHEHKIVDLDPMFVVDPDTRAIVSMSDTKTTLMQYDHNSERITFAVPRYREEHDMSLCKAPDGRIEIHYINIGVNGKRNEDVYDDIDDLDTFEDDEGEWVTFSWLVSQNATMYEGSLSFVIRFICGSEEEFDYVWNTALCNDISIGKGMDNAKLVVMKYADVLSEWYNEFIAAGNTGVSRIENATTDALAKMNPEIEAAIGAELAEALTIMQTETDEIVNTILERLPKAEEASF